MIVFLPPVWVSAGSGRTAWTPGAKRPDVVGNVILHDKLELWKSSKGSVHYHQGSVYQTEQQMQSHSDQT